MSYRCSSKTIQILHNRNRENWVQTSHIKRAKEKNPLRKNSVKKNSKQRVVVKVTQSKKSLNTINAITLQEIITSKEDNCHSYRSLASTFQTIIVVRTKTIVVTRKFDFNN